MIAVGWTKVLAACRAIVSGMASIVAVLSRAAGYRSG
jgi:hypothetical protein